MPQPDSRPEPNFDSDRETLLKWIAYMDDYGQRWLDDIGKDYFSQEYWYLFTVALVSHWRQTPLSVSEACQSMRTGSSRTKEKRVSLAVTRGMLIKEKSSSDLRTTHVLASDTLEELLIGHFERTLRELLGLTRRLLGGEVVGCTGG